MSTRRAHVASAFGLILALAAAGVVAWAGWRWAERAETRRTPPDPELLQEFARSVRDELRRLQRVYEDHLADIAAMVRADPARGLTPAAELGRGLKGLRQLSLLAAERGPGPAHVSVDGRLNPSWPEPVLLRTGERVTRTYHLPLPLEEVFPPARPADEIGRAGWSGPAEGPWLLHWQVIAPRRVLVGLIDRAEIIRVIEEHLRTWSAETFGPLQTTRAAVALRRTDGERVFGREPDDAGRIPEFSQSLGNELGAWQLAAWDRVEQTRWRDPARLAGAWALAGALAGGGWFAFRQQRRALRQAEERVSFVNRVSHELRTPVTNMLLNLDLLRDHLGPAANGARRRLDLVSEEAQRLSRLVANVLTFSRPARGPLATLESPVFPDEIIRAVLEAFAPALARRGLKATHAGHATHPVRLNADALAQILANLVSNVEKYAADGGFLGIESRLAVGHLTIVVEDRGPGIPAAARDRVFRPFERLSDRVDEGATGAGLGLSIARDLAERLGGSLRLVPCEMGARFELTLPVTMASVAPAAPTPASAPA